jgi:hypothetical protein
MQRIDLQNATEIPPEWTNVPGRKENVDLVPPHQYWNHHLLDKNSEKHPFVVTKAFDKMDIRSLEFTKISNIPGADEQVEVVLRSHSGKDARSVPQIVNGTGRAVRMFEQRIDCNSHKAKPA